VRARTKQAFLSLISTSTLRPKQFSKRSIITLYVDNVVYACVCVCMFVCVCMCVCACMAYARKVCVLQAY
jgi:hypothetical protein